MNPRKKNLLTAVLIAVLVLCATAGTVYAYLSTASGPAANTFTPDAPTDPTISETFNNLVKSDVKVEVGDPGYAVYVRAVIVVTWEDADGNIYATKPVAGTDYTIELNEADWFEKDGFYYHKAMVDSGSTAALIKECYQTAEAPTDYQLHVEIISQTIQALGTTDDRDTPAPAVTDAWDVTVSDGKLSED